MHLLVAHTLIGRQSRNVFRTKRIDCIFQRRRAARQSHTRADIIAQPRLEFDIAFEPTPKGLGRHAHHNIAGLAGHNIAHGIGNRLADRIDEGEKHIIARQIRLADEEARKMPGDARRNDALAIIFHANIGGGNDHPDPRAFADPGFLGLWHGCSCVRQIFDAGLIGARSRQGKRRQAGLPPQNVTCLRR